MSRIPQPEGDRGSLRWIQRAVNERWPALEGPIVRALGEDQPLDWRSPRADDDFAEYRDGDFLKALDLDHLTPALEAFWPKRGPQWDALAISAKGVRLLVEAKAHVGEMCSSPSGASAGSLETIVERLEATALAMGARRPHAPWHELFYQLGNRFAHLHWLRSQGVDARLVLVNFLGDPEMGGPRSVAEWQAAYQVAMYTMGLLGRHKLARFIIEVHPDVSDAAGQQAAPPS